MLRMKNMKIKILIDGLDNMVVGRRFKVKGEFDFKTGRVVGDLEV